MESLDPKGLMGRGGQLLLRSLGVVINALIPSGTARVWKCSHQTSRNPPLCDAKSGESRNGANGVFPSLSVSPIQRPKERILLVRG